MTETFPSFAPEILNRGIPLPHLFQSAHGESKMESRQRAEAFVVIGDRLSRNEKNGLNTVFSTKPEFADGLNARLSG